MDQRDDEFLDQSTRLLKRNAADKVRPGLLQISRHSRQAVGGQPDVGIEEHKKRMASRPCQKRAGELLATPARGKRLSSQETDAVVSLRDGGDDIGRGVVGMIVQHHDFKLDAPAGEDRLQRQRRWRSPRCARVSAPKAPGRVHRRPERRCRGRRTILTQVGAEQERGDGGEDEDDRSQADHHHDGASAAQASTPPSAVLGRGTARRANVPATTASNRRRRQRRPCRRPVSRNAAGSRRWASQARASCVRGQGRFNAGTPLLDGSVERPVRQRWLGRTGRALRDGALPRRDTPEPAAE